MVRRSILAGLLLAASVSLAQQGTTPAKQPAPLAAASAPQTSAQNAPKKPSKTAKTASKHQKNVEKVAENPAPELPPPPPPTPEQSPAAAPQVSYQNGQLSIRSDNSTLSSILAAVRASTGASIEAPGSTATDRIATILGPGNARDVLSSLLDNSKYNFILLGAPGRPAAVQKIILTAKANTQVGGAPAPATTAIQRQPQFQPQAQPDVDQELPDAEIPDEANQPEQPEPPPPPPTEPVQNPAEGDPSGQPNGNQPKTPEQLLQELQRMQQQQQQQQQQQLQQNLNPH